jgi:hypothetical protein
MLYCNIFICNVVEPACFFPVRMQVRPGGKLFEGQVMTQSNAAAPELDRLAPEIINRMTLSYRYVPARSENGDSSYYYGGDEAEEGDGIHLRSVLAW